jgi:hypothetical protein
VFLATDTTGKTRNSYTSNFGRCVGGKSSSSR